MKWCGGMVTEHCSSVETANVQSEMSHPALPVRLTPCHGLSHRARFASVPDINSIRDFQMRPSFASWGLLALLLLQGRCSGPAAVTGSPATVEPEQPAFATSRSGSPEQGPVGQGGTGQPAGRTTVADARRTSREPRGRRRAGAPAVRRADRGEQAGPVPPAQPAATGRWPGGRPERIRSRLNQLNLELLRGYAPALAELRVDDCRPRLNQALQRQVRVDRLDELHAIALSRAAGDLCHWAAL